MHQKRLEKKEKIRFKRKSVFEFFFDREIFKNKFSSILKKKNKKKKKTFDEVMSFERTAISWISACGCTIEKALFLSIVGEYLS